MKTHRRLIAAIIGSARASSDEEGTAAALGEELVDAGFRVLTGGLGGVMQAASRGARRAARYQSGDVIGILPSYDASHANEFVDIPICTGLNHGRNLVVVASADVVLAVGGQSGTLSEIALAWQLGKPVIAVGAGDGWGRRLAGVAIDDRRSDRVHGPLPPAEAVELAVRLVAERGPAPKVFP
ncbi:MAG: TIGR00725 family protein [Deltaproteobacteria bacterium]|nr:TIGR00725 family protein [Deltaproteobacteria bacterium]